MKSIKLLSILLLLPITFLFAQEDSESDVEEVVVVGSQIKGAKITGALPVTVITAEDIESLAIESGEENKGEQPKPQENKLSPEEAQRLLEALNQQEEKVQDKMKKHKLKGAKVKIEKDW